MIDPAPIARRPQLHRTRPTALRMCLVAACAASAVLQSALTDSFATLAVAAAVLLAALASEGLVSALSPSADLRDGSAVATAFILCLLLPNRVNPVAAALASAFAILVVKQSFGGLGANWLNPAVAGWLFLRLSWPSAFSQALGASPLSLLQGAVAKGLVDPAGSPLAILKIAGFKGGPADASITAALNEVLFARLGAKLPEGYAQFFFSGLDGIIADRGVSALLLFTVLVSALPLNRRWIPVVFLSVYGALVRGFGALPFGGNLGNGDMLFALLSGGTLAAAFLLASDPVTGAKSTAGAALLAAIAAIAAFLLRYLWNEPYGAILAVAAANILAPMLRSVEARLFFKSWRTA